ncbi:longevity assurance proteins LAG1/LAC1 [Thozetella sp. PMI_491]|nr:longevity assurance proteins LAG1/LAC1 [Thozetella sp. PMI_491]
MNGPLYMQTANNTVLVRRTKRTNEGPGREFLRWFVENQIGLSFNLLALLFLTHICFPKARILTSNFFSLAYYSPQSGEYGLGIKDGYFIFFCVVLFTGLRAACMEYVLAPLAKSLGIVKRKPITRFSEQAWLFVYYSFFWPLGMYIYCKSPYYLNLEELWTNWPSREVTGIMKSYMLAQLAFWLQQILVINIEERRNDHWQMFTHHIVTISLIYGSYRYHYTRVGNLILVLMDVVDLFFPLAKCLKYAGYSTLCDITFGLFMLSWVVARHIFYMMVWYSAWAHTPRVIGNSCYKGPSTNLTGPFFPPEYKNGGLYLLEPLWSSESQICFDQNLQWSFLTTLLFLQAIMLVWFRAIVRVAIRVIRGDGADDVRSDDEGEEEEDEIEYEEAQLLEEEVGVDEIDLKNWERRTGIKRQSSTSGVSLPGHSDRKELLGRIGCEKQVD